MSSNRSHRFIADTEDKRACPFCSIVLRYHEGPNIWYCSGCGYSLVAEVEDSKAKEEREASSDPALNSTKKHNWRDGEIFIESIMRPRYEDARRRVRTSAREVFDKDIDYLNQKPGYVLKDSREWTADSGTFSYQSSPYNGRSRTSRHYH